MPSRLTQTPQLSVGVIGCTTAATCPRPDWPGAVAAMNPEQVDERFTAQRPFQGGRHEELPGPRGSARASTKHLGLCRKTNAAEA